jgi:hypothetical protein
MAPRWLHGAGRRRKDPYGAASSVVSDERAGRARRSPTGSGARPPCGVLFASNLRDGRLHESALKNARNPHQRHDLVKLAGLIDWQAFADKWSPQFESTTGRKPIDGQKIPGTAPD